MMKRQEKKYRFYLWDYLWWTGERLHDYNYRITGNDMLQMYILFFVYFPALSLRPCAKSAFVDHLLSIYILTSCLVLILVWWIWNKKIYGVDRRKAVMKHYADTKFSPGKGYLLFFLPMMFFLTVYIILMM